MRVGGGRECQAEGEATLTAALEQHSEHPIAKGIVRAANEKYLALPAISNFASITGKGIQGDVSGKKISVVSPGFLQEKDIALPKSAAGAADIVGLSKGDVAVYRVIRGTAEFKDGAGKRFELATGDSVTAGCNSATLVGLGENTQLLRLGLLKGMDDLCRWTAAQRDEIDGLAGRIITRKEARPQRTQGKPVGFLYE